ncbi:FixH family protein [Bacillus sp. AFS040349]|uniref:FixH family protein n=1 Tax=Bacillus sp. AFS040349 TaxID=2033502 RepID=UPI00210050AA|nr:FixH family protein [Bacillus sp. AFS040349]
MHNLTSKGVVTVKKFKAILLLPFMMLILSACSLELKQDVAKQYKEEEPMVADIIIRDSLSTNSDTTFQVVLTQGEEKVVSADYVHFEIWKQDGSVKFEMEQAEEVGNGTYQLSKKLDSEGLYFIKVHASSNDSIIMPQKQFIVGELSESELEFLQKGAVVEDGGGEHHH